MVSLTCKNHPELLWHVKEIAWTRNPDGTGHYNGQRNIHFMGDRNYKLMRECSCPASDLVEIKPEPEKQNSENPV